MTQPLQTVHQFAYVVKDLDQALKYWVEELKVGPFYVYEHCPLDNQIYRGNTGKAADVTLALGYSGDAQIELIVQHNDAPSVYKEWIDVGKEGLHHFGIMPVDYHAARQHYIDIGHEPAFECTIGDAPLVYFDTLDVIGHYTEFWDNSPVYKDLFKMLCDAHKNWDGKDPVRQGVL